MARTVFILSALNWYKSDMNHVQKCSYSALGYEIVILKHMELSRKVLLDVAHNFKMVFE